MNLPVRLLAVMDSRFAGAQIDGDIVVDGVEVEEIFFDYFRFISQSDNKLVDSVVGIDIHDVPEDRSAADFDHRLWDAKQFPQTNETQIHPPG